MKAISEGRQERGWNENIIRKETGKPQEGTAAWGRHSYSRGCGGRLRRGSAPSAGDRAEEGGSCGEESSAAEGNDNRNSADAVII